MKASFIKLDSLEETEDGTVTINANNISLTGALITTILYKQ